MWHTATYGLLLLALFTTCVLGIWLVGRLRRQIAELRRVELALRRSGERYRTASELTSDYTYCLRIEPDGAVVVEWLAGAFAEITGYKPSEVDAVGGVVRMIHPDDLPVALRRVQTLVSGESDVSEFRIITKSGDICWVRENARPVWDTASRTMRIFGAAQDITARKRAEDEARQRHADLAHVLRVNTIGEMAAGLAHEINQPLSAIVSYAKGSVRRLQAGTGQPHELRNVMEQIAEQAIRADQIVRRLRRFVRREDPHREPVGVNDLVRGVEEFVEGDARALGVTVRMLLQAGLPPVEADRIQIEQVILNLVRNGLEAMAGSDPTQRVLSIQTTMSGADAVEVAVGDTGRGLPAEVAPRAFDEFFTTKTNGLGMGLSISRSIIEAHGGRLWADTDAGRGATFRFTVPVTLGGPSDAD